MMFTRTSMFRTKSRSSVESSDICKSQPDCMQERPLQGCSTLQMQTSVVVFGLWTGTHSHSHHASSHPDKPGTGQNSRTKILPTIPDAEEAGRQLIAGLMDHWTVGGSLTERALPPRGFKPGTSWLWGGSAHRATTVLQEKSARPPHICTFFSLSTEVCLNL